MIDKNAPADLGRGGPFAPALVGLLIIAAFLSTIMIWGAYAAVSGAAVADGVLKVEGNRQAVQHPYGGVVKTLHVREGDKVQRGQTLLTLSAADPQAKLAVLASQWIALKAQEARLIAERDSSHDLTVNIELAQQWPDASIAQAFANERAVLRARRRQYDTEIGSLRQKIVQLEEQKRGLRAQAQGVERQAALIEEEAQGVRELLKSGLTPKPRLLALERTAAGLLADRGARLSDIAGANEAIAGAELEIARREHERTTEVTNALRAAQTSLAELAPKIEAAKDVLARTNVTSPANGAVVGLTIFTEGGVAQPGARLLDIVPSDSALIAEGRLQLHDVNEATVGRRADVRLTGVHRSDRPTLSGIVSNISADRLTDERTGQGYYLIQVRLDPDQVRNAGIDMQAGMPAQIVVSTRPRTLVDYLIAPLLDEISGAFRER